MVERAIRCAVLVSLIAIGSVAVAQLVESIDVSIVNVDALVTDRAGNPVHGLTAADFEIYDDGLLQPVSNFAEYRADWTESGAKLETPALPSQRRTLILFLENDRLGAYGEMFDALKKVIRSTVRPGDAVTIILWNDAVATSTTVVAYTDDVAAIERALDRIHRGGLRANPERLPLGARSEEQRPPDLTQMAAMRDRQTSLRPNPAAADPWILAQIAFRKLKMKTNAIKAAIQGIAGLEGKKVVLIGVNRFSQIAGAEYFYSGSVQLLPGDVRAAFNTDALMNSVVETANAHGVTLYPINYQGLGRDVMGSADIAGPVDPAVKFIPQLIFGNETPTLTEVAEKTGGAASWSQKDIVKFLPQISRDFTDYYSLAFRVDGNRGLDRTHHLSVKVKNADYIVRSRTQFVQQSEAARMRERVAASLVSGLVEGRSIEFSTQIGKPHKRDRATYVVPVKISIPVASLTSLPDAGGYAGTFSVFIAHRGILGDLSDVAQRTQKFTIPAAEIAKARTSTFAYTFDLVVEMAADRLAVGVLDDVSKQYGVSVTKLRL